MTNATPIDARLRGYLKCWETGDKAHWPGLFADAAVVMDDPVGTPTQVGIEAISAFWDRIHQLPMSFLAPPSLRSR